MNLYYAYFYIYFCSCKARRRHATSGAAHNAHPDIYTSEARSENGAGGDDLCAGLDGGWRGAAGGRTAGRARASRGGHRAIRGRKARGIGASKSKSMANITSK